MAQGGALELQVDDALDTTCLLLTLPSLEFEQPIADLESRIDELRYVQNESAVDISEEIDRLKAHVTAARELLSVGGPVGRKLDFLAQEFNRESNTICSKSNAVAVTAAGIELKVVIDQFREQVQNLE